MFKERIVGPTSSSCSSSDAESLYSVILMKGLSRHGHGRDEENKCILKVD